MVGYRPSMARPAAVGWTRGRNADPHSSPPFRPGIRTPGMPAGNLGLGTRFRHQPNLPREDPPCPAVRPGGFRSPALAGKGDQRAGRERALSARGHPGILTRGSTTTFHRADNASPSQQIATTVKAHRRDPLTGWTGAPGAARVLRNREYSPGSGAPPHPTHHACPRVRTPQAGRGSIKSGGQAVATHDDQVPAQGISTPAYSSSMGRTGSPCMPFTTTLN
jgi:hypothetical protein